MSDTRFSGMKMYRHLRAEAPMYEVRGDTVYQVGRDRPEFVIRDDCLYRPEGDKPLFDIRGSYIHEYQVPSQPLWEIR